MSESRVPHGHPTPLTMPHSRNAGRRAADRRGAACGGRHAHHTTDRGRPHTRWCAPSALNGGRTALLVDLENMLYENEELVSHDVGAARIEAIFDVAGHADHIFVAARPWALEPHIDLFARRRAPVGVVETREPDAADHLLGDRLGFLAGRDFDEFYIASRDGYFAKFAARHHTTVLSPNLRTVSHRLRRVAAGIIVLHVRLPYDAHR